MGAMFLFPKDVTFFHVADTTSTFLFRLRKFKCNFTQCYQSRERRQNAGEIDF